MHVRKTLRLSNIAMEHFCGLLRHCRLLFVLLSLQAPYAYTQDFDCTSECFGDFDHNQLSSNPNCQIILHSLNCYEANIDECFDQGFQNVFNYQDALSLAGLCEGSTPETTSSSPLSTGTPPPPASCPSVPGMLVGGSSGSMQDFVLANIFTDAQPQGCTMYSPDNLQHCSMFGYAHLRAFGGYRQGLETCSIPGAWDLFQHSSFSVQVEGKLEDVNSSHTKLTKVNVTFYKTDCLEESKSFVADHQHSLPRTFTDNTTPDHQNSSLLLNTDENGTVATILALWINATIIIRRHAGLLSVTLQVPGMVSFQSDGLCTGCPPHAYVNITQYSDGIREDCVDETTNVNTNCFIQAGVANQAAFNGIVNNTYLDTCVFSLFKGGSIGVLELFNRIASDAKLLPSIGNVPPRPHSPSPPSVDQKPTVPNIVSTTDSDSSLSPIRQTQSEMDTTSDFFSSATPQTYVALHYSSSLLVTLLIVSIGVFLTR